MKKTIVVVMLLVVALSLGLAACAPDPAEPGLSLEKSVTIYVVLGEEQLAKYQRTTEASTVADLFIILVNEEDSQFAYNSDISSFGQFVKSVTVATDAQWVSTGLFPSAANHEFVAFYHTIDNAKYRDYQAGAIEYEGKQYYFSAVGINATPLIDGASYIFTIDSW